MDGRYLCVLAEENPLHLPKHLIVQGDERATLRHVPEGEETNDMVIMAINHRFFTDQSLFSAH